MGVLSLQSLIGTMNDRRRAGAGQNEPYGDLVVLLSKLDSMYQYRNNTKKDGDQDQRDGQGNRCYQHWYSNYTSYLRSKGLNAETKSIGDIDQAISNMAYCSCDTRQIGGCTCVSVINNGAKCSCNARNPYTCECHARTGGKYDPVCYCDTRNAAEGGSKCSCVSRSSYLYCECNARCVCHSVSEYTMTSQPEIRAHNSCFCETRQYADACVNHYSRNDNPCLCQVRTIECNGVSNAPNNWDGYCGWHKRPTTRGICQCNERSSSYNYCECHSRGRCNEVYTSPYYPTKYDCQCNVRGGVMPI